MIRATLGALALSLAFASPTVGQELAAGGTWANTRGSTLTIDSVQPDGAIAGTYVNRAPGFACQGTPFPAAGWVNGDKISFSVDWRNQAEDCNSITSWVGYLSAGRIVTNWDLVYTDATEQRPMFQRGSDLFTPQ
ncbi:MAG: avidin/streptavidin family protein [Salinarimonas sp.]